MASAPQPNLPLFYNDLMPLNSNDHKSYHLRPATNAKFLGEQHAVPLTTDEFVQASRHFPIVFSSGEEPLPLALMGLNEGINTFVDDKGMLSEQVYLPAYIRRYPFMLARLRQDSEELSLCFDPTCESVGDFKEGQALFADDGATPSDATKNVLEFCQQFEMSAQKTQAFMKEMADNDLLMDGEVAIQMPGAEKPFVYRGFRMVDQAKLQNISAEKALEWTKNGVIAIIFAHIFSLELMSTIFAKQTQQGKGPAAQAAPQINA